MDEMQFWLMIETAWKAVGGKVKVRQKLADGKLSDEKTQELEEYLEEVIESLRTQLRALPAADLAAFDRILERKLFDIDRAEIQEYTDGSDDGFLYARGFIVAMGEEYYDAVDADPALAKADCICGAMCYISLHLYEEKFGKLPTTAISRETGSNKAGWPDDN